MAFKDLREFIDKLEAEGELVRIKQEVDWNLEAGAIIRKCEETMDGPAPLFEKFKGYPEGYRLLGDPFSSGIKKFAIAAGLPLNMSHQDTYRALMDLWDEGLANMIKPRIVSTGPCKENILKGDEVNLYKLPALMLHDGDGGRYIGSLHTTVAKDPDSDWVNWGCYRQMIHNKNHLGGFVAPAQDMASIFGKFEVENKPMPFATAIGTDPIITAVSVSALPFGVSEADVAGGIRKEPIDLVKCETNDLYVPATAEVVLEGHVLPNVRMDEGPFGEYTGYRASPRAPRIVYRIDCITYRNDPILTAVVEGIPITTSHSACAITWAAGIRKALRDEGLPIIDVNIEPQAGLFIAVISTKTPYPGIAHRIASVAWGCKSGQFVPKLMVVDDDISPYNMNEVIHAFGSKCHPVRGTHTVPYAAGNPLIPYQNLEERLWAKGCRVLYDCTWPVDWPREIAVPPRSAFNSIYPKAIQEKVLANWKNYGFKK